MLTFVIYAKSTDFSSGSPVTEFEFEFGGPEAEAVFGGQSCRASVHVPLGPTQVADLKTALSDYCSANRLPATWAAYLDGKEI